MADVPYTQQTINEISRLRQAAEEREKSEDERRREKTVRYLKAMEELRALRPNEIRWGGKFATKELAMIINLPVAVTAKSLDSFFCKSIESPDWRQLSSI